MSDRHLAPHVSLVSNNSPYPFSLLCPSLPSLHRPHILCPRLLSFLGCGNAEEEAQRIFRQLLVLFQ